MMCQQFWRPSRILTIYMSSEVKIVPAINSAPIDY